MYICPPAHVYTYKHTAYCGGSHPVNALTLEEVHERENIYHTQSPSASDPDQSAFNRLVAVLQSSGAIQDEPTQVRGLVRMSLPRLED